MSKFQLLVIMFSAILGAMVSSLAYTLGINEFYSLLIFLLTPLLFVYYIAVENMFAAQEDKEQDNG